MRISISMAALCAMSASTFAFADEPVVMSVKDRCCLSKKGPEPVFYTGAWLNGLYTRAECVAKKYGFWDGDVPNVAKKVCAIRPREWPPNPPVDPVPRPPEDPDRH